MLFRNDITIGVTTLYGRKRPSLVVIIGNECKVVASFNSTDNAEYFTNKVHEMFSGLIMDTDEEDSDKRMDE